MRLFNNDPTICASCVLALRLSEQMSGLVDTTYLASKVSPSHSLSTGFDDLGFVAIKHWHTVFFAVDAPRNALTFKLGEGEQATHIYCKWICPPVSVVQMRVVSLPQLISNALSHATKFPSDIFFLFLFHPFTVQKCETFSGPTARRHEAKHQSFNAAQGLVLFVVVLRHSGRGRKRR